MKELEELIGLVLAAVILATAARRVGAPYPVFLALGGALLAFLPGAPSFTVPPDLALALQGLTLKPLLRALDLHDDDPVGRELGAARDRALRAGLASFEHDRSSVAEALRQEFAIHLASASADAGAGQARRSAHRDLHRGALHAARQAIHAMRANDEIGDDAFHQIEEELDWLEMAGRGKEESTSEE